jgi:4-hydroxy-3-methylbut-2-enyl diphosphate reductase
MGNLFTALGAFFLGAAAMFLMDLYFRPMILAIGFLFVFALHTLTMLADPQALALNVPARARAMTRRRKTWAAAGVAALVLGSLAGFSINPYYGGALVGLAGLSLLYPVRLVTRARLSIRSLAEVPASKDLFMAMGWATLLVLLPLLAIEDDPDLPSLAVTFLFVFGLVFVRALLRDFRDIQADRLIGRDTLPIALGAPKTRLVIYLTLAGLAVLVTIAGRAQIVQQPVGLFMLAPLAGQAVCVPLFTRKTVLQGFRAEAITDAAFIISGLAGLIGFFLSINR